MIVLATHTPNISAAGWWDIALLLYIAGFLVLKAFLFQREDRLGWSLSLVNVCFGVVYLWSASLRLVPEGSWVYDPRLSTGIRVVLAALVTWSVVELVVASRKMRRSGHHERRSSAERREEG